MPLGPNHAGEFRGGGFVLDSDAVTLAAANTTKTAAGTMKLVNGFVNPIASKKNIAVIYAIVATVSGTPAGGFFWNALPLTGAQTITSAATGTIHALNNYGSGAASAVTPLVNVIVVVSDASTTAFTQVATLGGPIALAATGVVETVVEKTQGRIILPPGTVFGIAATGAGTTHVVQSTIYWEELQAS